MILTSIFKARYIFAFMAMLGLSLTYMTRYCLGLVITKMVSNKFDDPDKTYAWDEKTQGIILSTFFVGSFLSHIPGAILSEKFGGKYPFGLGILFVAIFTVLIPLVVDDDPTGFIIVRFLAGVAEGVIHPGVYALLAQWSPPKDKTFIFTTVLMGETVGQLLVNMVTGFILQYFPNNSWKLVFGCFGTMSIIWFFLWWTLCYNDPKSHPYISEKEKQYFVEEMKSIERDKNLQPTPWKFILTSGSVWAYIIVEFGQKWGNYVIMVDLPKYFNDVPNFSSFQNGLLYTYSYLTTGVVGWVASAFCNYVLRKNLLTESCLRKSYASITAVGLSVGFLTASYTENTSLISTCVILGIGSLAFSFSSVSIVPMDLSPNYCASINALANGIGNIAGFVSPNLIGLLTPNSSAEEWRMVFWIVGGVLQATNLIFLVFGSCKLEVWNDLTRRID